MTTAIVQQLRWDGSRLADQVMRCADCGTPVVEIKDGCLIYLAKHHGEVHRNTIRVMPVDTKRLANIL